MKYYLLLSALLFAGCVQDHKPPKLIHSNFFHPPKDVEVFIDSLGYAAYVKKIHDTVEVYINMGVVRDTVYIHDTVFFPSNTKIIQYHLLAPPMPKSINQSK